MDSFDGASRLVHCDNRVTYNHRLGEQHQVVNICAQGIVGHMKLLDSLEAYNDRWH